VNHAGIPNWRDAEPAISVTRAGRPGELALDRARRLALLQREHRFADRRSGTPVFGTCLNGIACTLRLAAILSASSPAARRRAASLAVAYRVRDLHEAALLARGEARVCGNRRRCLIFVFGHSALARMNRAAPSLLSRCAFPAFGSWRHVRRKMLDGPCRSAHHIADPRRRNFRDGDNAPLRSRMCRALSPSLRAHAGPRRASAPICGAPGCCARL